MSKYQSYFNSEHLYFVTTSLLNKRFRFLSQPPYVDLILQNLTFLRHQERILLFAFAIMPNHLHFIAKVLPSYNISQVMHSLKSYSSSQLNKLLYQNDFYLWQEIKRFGGKIWQEGFFDENIYSQKFLNEKIEYIHNNPCNKNWRLVKDRAKYKYSSAGYYDLGTKPIIKIDDIELVLQGKI